MDSEPGYLNHSSCATKQNWSECNQDLNATLQQEDRKTSPSVNVDEILLLGLSLILIHSPVSHDND